MPVEEQKPPEQQTLEEEPFSFTKSLSYGATHVGNLTPQELDAKLPQKMRDFCDNWIVATDQFDEMENAGGAFVCARVLRMFLIFFIVSSVFGLIVGFILKASLAAPMETEQYSDGLAAPSVVFCASPWGTDFLGFDFQAAEKGLIPGTDFKAIGDSNISFTAFDPKDAAGSAQWLHGCKLVKLTDVILQPHGKVAQYTGFETIRLTIKAQSEDGKFNFGYCNGDNELPQRWYYGSLGSRISGEISYDQVNIGASDVSHGTPRSIFNFNTRGTALLGAETQLEYYYGYFMIRALAAQPKGLSLFAVIAFILLVAAAVNNCGLFELFFVEYVPPDEPQPTLVPNILCQTIFGPIFSSCRVREKTAYEEAVVDAEAEAGNEAPPVQEESLAAPSKANTQTAAPVASSTA